MDYIPSNDAEFYQQLVVFNTNLPSYAPQLSIESGVMVSSQNDCDYFGYILGGSTSVSNSSRNWNNGRKLARYGTGSAFIEPDIPTLPPYVAPVLPGIESRFRALVRQIKAHPNYTQAIGKALGIVSATPAPLDITKVKPKISVKRIGIYNQLYWGWGHYRGALQACDIYVDRGDGKGFVFLVSDMTPNYLDTYPQPGTISQWTYKAIYRAKDMQVGQWSDPVTIAVGG